MKLLTILINLILIIIIPCLVFAEGENINLEGVTKDELLFIYEELRKANLKATSAVEADATGLFEVDENDDIQPNNKSTPDNYFELDDNDDIQPREA